METKGNREREKIGQIISLNPFAIVLLHSFLPSPILSQSSQESYCSKIYFLCFSSPSLSTSVITINCRKVQWQERLVRGKGYFGNPKGKVISLLLVKVGCVWANKQKASQIGTLFESTDL